MGAGLVVDIGQTCQFHPSIVQTVSGGVIVGLPIDLKNSDTLCNVFVAAGAGSGPVGVQVQTSDVASGFIASGAGLPTSGSFTDPTSGLSGLSVGLLNSGGILWINSGLVTFPRQALPPLSGQQGAYPVGMHPIYNAQGAGGFNASSGSAPVFGSGGGVAFGSFLRPHRFARLVMMSGASLLGAPTLIAGFVTNLKTTGSGGGFDFRPTSGVVAV